MRFIGGCWVFSQLPPQGFNFGGIMLIGFGYRAGVGKDAVCDYLSEKHGWIILGYERGALDLSMTVAREKFDIFAPKFFCCHCESSGGASLLQKNIIYTP